MIGLAFDADEGEVRVGCEGVDEGWRGDEGSYTGEVSVEECGDGGWITFKNAQM